MINNINKKINKHKRGLFYQNVYFYFEGFQNIMSLIKRIENCTRNKGESLDISISDYKTLNR